MNSEDPFVQPPDSPFFDRHDMLKTWWNVLPHWEQLGKTQFITFRLADSLPQSKLSEIQTRKNCFIQLNPKPWDSQTKTRFERIVTSKMEQYIDQGYGSCILRNPGIRKIVSDALEYHDGVKYNLIGYVIMPNHVHALTEMIGAYEANVTFELIKRYTARNINAITGKSGNLWGRSFDRLVRNEEHLKNCIYYIRYNPRFLQPDEYTLGGMAFREPL